MSKAKTERNKLIVKLVDENHWSYPRIAEEVGLKARSTVCAIYKREKKGSQLSTVLEK